MKEIFKSICDYEGLYEISNFGRVKSLKRIISYSNRDYTKEIEEKIKTQKLNNSGYKIIILSKNGKKKTLLIHRLVAITFLLNPKEKKEVNHLDKNKTNNLSNNLEWSTRKENMIHAYKTGTRHNEEFIKKRKLQNKKRHVNRKMKNNFKCGQQQGDLKIIEFEGTEGNRSYFKVKCLRCDSIKNHIKINDNQRRCKSCAMKKASKKRIFNKQ